MDEVHVKKDVKTFKWDLAKQKPILAFLLITFVWTWGFWLGAIPLQGRDDLLQRTIVFIGGFGPAMGGILTLSLKNGIQKKRFGQILVWVIVTAIILGLMAWRLQVGNASGIDPLPNDTQLTPVIWITGIFASILGGWVISSARCGNVDVRARMASILPQAKNLGWTLLAIVIYPIMVLASWGIASALGLGVEMPASWGQPLMDVVPLALLSFLLTFFMTGGNEEPGWRGFLQPELQKKMSPLGAALIVSLVWSLWHLPLYLNGFYGGPIVGGMIGSGIFRILLSIFLAWFYNRSGGNVLAMIILHTTFNMAVNFLPTSDLALAVMWLIISIAVVISDKMWKKKTAV